MAGSKLRAIIFDIGRVLVRVDVARAMDGLGAQLNLTPAELWSAIEKDPAWKDWQEGRMSARDYHLRLSARLGSSLPYEKFADAWNLALDPTPLQEVSLFERLAKRYRLALLSNTDPIHVAHMEARYEFFRYFPARVYSCAVGASKPNPLIYREALRACRAKANESLYIDDVPGYVDAAKALGMSGVLYQSPEQLRSDLAKAGVEL